MRALAFGAKGAINGVWRQRTFVIRLDEGAEPTGSVTFYDDPQSERGGAAQNQNLPAEIVGLLDRVKTFRLIVSADSDPARPIEHVAPGNVCHYRDFQVIMEEVCHFEAENTLVFKLRF